MKQLTRFALGLCGLGLALTADAQNSNLRGHGFELDLHEARADKVIISQDLPDYPSATVRRGQEGWVRVHYVVTADGHAADPIVLDSSGGVGFEEEARKVLVTWRFEAPASGVELPDNQVIIRSEMENGRDKATPNFMRRYARIVNAVRADKIAEARKSVDSAYKLGGWNLYESTMLWLMMGRVESAEGNLQGKLECYRRALGVSTRGILRRADKIDLLEKIFRMEDEFGQHAEALGTYGALIRALKDNSPSAEIEARAQEIQALIEGPDALVAQATIYNPCNCEAGEPLWHYKPARRTFSFANLSGNVTRFEARCEKQRIRGQVEADQFWTLEPEWGNCRIFVFGEDGATFEVLEYADTVARDDVLDPRNRGQRG
ncbi:MAG: energy transducer TonB [Woeseiaceae bacterium]|nr:energy transducer TonB [Woeseiaceae bacterium]